MEPVLKLLFFLFFLLAVIFAGNKVHTLLNDKIKGSNSGWSLMGYIILLIAVYILLFCGCLLLLVKSYDFLMS